MLKSAGRFVLLFMDYTKTYTAPDELVALLQNRGLDCSDTPDAEQLLKSVGYYRFSGYLHPFLKQPKTEHRFKPESTIGAAINLYEFDRKLRQLIFDQIERIEIAVRSAIVNITCAQTNDVFWITNPAFFARTDRYNRTISLINKELNVSREEFITHFREVYDNTYPPAWMLAEIMPLGTLTRVYENIANNRIRKRIAQSFGLNIPVFTSWMTIITLTRNTCCHHARLWNRSLSLRAQTMDRHEWPWISENVQQGRVFFTLCIIKHFIDVIVPGNTLKKDLSKLLRQYPNVDLAAMGFPVKWKREPIWR